MNKQAYTLMAMTLCFVRQYVQSQSSIPLFWSTSVSSSLYVDYWSAMHNANLCQECSLLETNLSSNHCIYVVASFNHRNCTHLQKCRTLRLPSVEMIYRTLMSRSNDFWRSTELWSRNEQITRNKLVVKFLILSLCTIRSLELSNETQRSVGFRDLERCKWSWAKQGHY